MKRMKLLQHGGLALAALVLLVLSLAAPWNAQAQTTRTLVSNQFAGDSGAHYIVGADPASQKVGQRFRTGSGTITLSNIQIFHYGESVAEEHRDQRRFRVRVCNQSGSSPYFRPGSTCIALTAPADDFGWTGSTSNNTRSFQGSSTFTAPASTTLSASSNYFVVIDNFTGPNSLKTTNSNDEDSSGLSGWGIGDALNQPFWGSWTRQRSVQPTDSLRTQGQRH